jgi:radical SAM/Cys-rich protein
MKSLPLVDSLDRRCAQPPSNDAFLRALAAHELSTPIRAGVTTLQVNVGKRCNMACHHCHVDAGPKRTESMAAETAGRVCDLIDSNASLELVDLTGGAPELNPSFRELVVRARRAGKNVIDRCNLSVLLEPGMESVASFLAEQRVHIIASLPCYGPENVDKQRGKGAFEKSLRALGLLNELGYGFAPELTLDLVYNPAGAFLPSAQAELEATYKEQLQRRFGVRFNRLLALTNMPIKRFAAMLAREEKLAEYMSLLASHFNPATVDGLMCRSLVSVGWDGRLYDCDFNQMLELPLQSERAPRTIWELESFDQFDDQPIATGEHCLGCTAGAGSSCSGATAA